MTGYSKNEIINEIFDRTKDIIQSTREFQFTAKIMRLNFIMTAIYERILKHTVEKDGGISGYSQEQHKQMSNWNFEIRNKKIKQKGYCRESFQQFFDLDEQQFRFFETKEKFSRDEILSFIYEEDIATEKGTELDDELLGKVFKQSKFQFTAVLSCLRNGLAHGMIGISSDVDRKKHFQERGVIYPIHPPARGIISNLMVVSYKSNSDLAQNIIIMDETALDVFCDCFQNYLEKTSNHFQKNLIEENEIQIEKKIKRLV